jgi:hypothetical protein
MDGKNRKMAESGRYENDTKEKQDGKKNTEDNKPLLYWSIT